jgi:hypothetical protein
MPVANRVPKYKHYTICFTLKIFGVTCTQQMAILHSIRNDLASSDTCCSYRECVMRDDTTSEQLSNRHECVFWRGLLQAWWPCELAIAENPDVHVEKAVNPPGMTMRCDVRACETDFVWRDLLVLSAWMCQSHPLHLTFINSMKARRHTPTFLL